MAVERIIDLENRRYADREYEGARPGSPAAAEQAAAERRELGIARLRARAAQRDEFARDVLIALGLDDE